MEGAIEGCEKYSDDEAGLKYLESVTYSAEGKKSSEKKNNW